MGNGCSETFELDDENTQVIGYLIPRLRSMGYGLIRWNSDDELENIETIRFALDGMSKDEAQDTARLLNRFSFRIPDSIRKDIKGYSSQEYIIGLNARLESYTSSLNDTLSFYLSRLILKHAETFKRCFSRNFSMKYPFMVTTFDANNSRFVKAITADINMDLKDHNLAPISEMSLVLTLNHLLSSLLASETERNDVVETLLLQACFEGSSTVLSHQNWVGKWVMLLVDTLARK